MKWLCNECERITLDRNLWCQEVECPAFARSLLFDYGDFLGDIEVVRLLRVLRTGVLYEARRDEKKLLLKVANADCADRLKREAVTLAQLAQYEQHPMLPVLAPPTRQIDVKQRPYGKTVFGDETIYYAVYEYMEGEFLRDVLRRNSQPWYQHAAWLVISLADAIAFMHKRANRLHLQLNPEMVLVREDRDKVLRPVLIDLGAAIEPSQIDPEWMFQYSHPAYTAPELLSGRGTAGEMSDVYGLGLLLYEMLAGHPAHPFRLQKREAVRSAVLSHEPEPLNRTDLPDDVVKIVFQAIARDPNGRHADVRTYAKGMRSRFGEVPRERVNNVGRRVVIGGIAAVLGVFVLLVFAAVFFPGG